MWVDLEQVKYCDQMWSELWHFMFVSFGKTFCRTLWYFGMYPRDITVHISSTVIQKRTKYCLKSKLSWVFLPNHVDMGSSDRPPKVRSKLPYQGENLLKVF